MFLSVEVSIYFLMKLSECTSVELLFDATFLVYKCRCTESFIKSWIKVLKWVKGRFKLNNL